MKNNQLGFLMALLLLSCYSFAQPMDKTAAFKNLQISYAKTTSLVFPYSIKSVDRGSLDVLVQKAKGVENILLVKAGRHNFEQTNLTVVTSDGKLYGFVLNYDQRCPDLNLIVDDSIVLNQEIQFSAESDNQKKMEQYANEVLLEKRNRMGIKRSRFEITLELTGIFIHQDVLYFKLQLSNESKVNFDIDQLRFFVGDQKKAKRTASQEVEIQPLLAIGEHATITAKSEVSLVFALPKISLAEKKQLVIQLIEKREGRQLDLVVKNDDLLHLKILNTL